MSAEAKSTNADNKDNNRIEVDSSGYDVDDGSSTLSDDIIMSYQVENGRRYHAYKEGRYVFPNDDLENDRLDLQHHMLKIAMDEKLYYAPLKPNIERMLDIGTGTGTWCIEMGDNFPNTQVIGNDLSPIQPSWVPPNVQFQVDDLESEWNYPEPFDYIHSRYMIGSIQDWPGLISKMFTALKPGGWAEFQDYDVRFYSEDGSAEGSNLCTWCNQAWEAGEKLGRTVSPAVGLLDRVRSAGFTDIHEVKLKIPLGQWPKDPKLKQIGSWNVLNILDGLEGWSLKLYTYGLGWSVDDIQALLVKVRRDIKDPKIHAQQDFHIIYGKKPAE